MEKKIRLFICPCKDEHVLHKLYTIMTWLPKLMILELGHFTCWLLIICSSLVCIPSDTRTIWIGLLSAKSWSINVIITPCIFVMATITVVAPIAITFPVVITPLCLDRNLPYCHHTYFLYRHPIIIPFFHYYLRESCGKGIRMIASDIMGCEFNPQ